MNEVRRRMDKKRYPWAAFDEGEQVEVVVVRHGFVRILVRVGVLVVLAGVVWAMIWLLESNTLSTTGTVWWGGLSLGFLVVLLGMAIDYVYKGNEMVVTNMRVIQRIRRGLFDDTVQYTELEQVEDVAAKKKGIMAYLIGYGEVRVSTTGDESTYSMKYVRDVEDTVKKISKWVNQVDKK